MASIYDLKPAFQGLLRPVVKAFARMGITANQVTLAALVLSIAVGIVFYMNITSRWAYFIIPGFMFFRMALNAIDGLLAREHDMKSDLGAILNEIGDVVSDSALYLPFACIVGIDARFVIIILLLSVISEMVGVVALQIKASRRYDGPMGKSDRAFVFGLIALLLGCGITVGIWLNILLLVVLFLLIVTIINRARKALGEVK